MTEWTEEDRTASGSGMQDAAPRKSAFTILRESKGFIQLFTGQGISAFGDWMATVAFIALTQEVTQSSTAVGGILILRLAPGVVAAPLAGRVVRRFDYRRTMITMDVLRFVMAVLVPFVLALWWIYLWAFLIEVASLMFLPARDSSIPELVDSEEALPLANSLILGSSFGTIPLGAIAFAMVAAFSAQVDIGFVNAAAHPIAFWIDGVTFLVSAFFISRIKKLKTAHVIEPGKEGTALEGKFLQAFRIPMVRVVIPPTLSITLGLGALFSLGIVLVRDVMHATDSQFGILIALFGVGAACGLGILQLRGSDRNINDFRYSVGAVGASIFVTVLTPYLYLGYIGAIFFGAAAAYAMAGGMSTLQERVVGEERVLAFTAFHVLIRAGLGVGAIVAGVLGQFLSGFTVPILGDLAPSQWVLFLAGALVLVSSTFIHDPQSD